MPLRFVSRTFQTMWWAMSAAALELQVKATVFELHGFTLGCRPWKAPFDNDWWNKAPSHQKACYLRGRQDLGVFDDVAALRSKLRGDSNKTMPREMSGWTLTLTLTDCLLKSVKVVSKMAPPPIKHKALINVDLGEAVGFGGSITRLS